MAEEIVCEVYIERERGLISAEPVELREFYETAWPTDTYLRALQRALVDLAEHMGVDGKVRIRLIRRDVPSSPPPSGRVH